MRRRLIKNKKFRAKIDGARAPDVGRSTAREPAAAPLAATTTVVATVVATTSAMMVLHQRAAASEVNQAVPEVKSEK